MRMSSMHSCSLKQAHRQVIRNVMRKREVALEAGDEAGVKEHALEECRLRGLLHGPLEHRDDHGETALITAAGDGDAYAVTILLQAGADGHAATEDYLEAGWTGMIKAANYGHVDVVRVLLKAGVPITGPKVTHRIDSNDGEGVQETGLDAPFAACWFSRWKVMEVFFENGLDPAHQDEYYGSLHHCMLLGEATDGKPECFEVLRKGGVDLRIPMCMGGQDIPISMLFEHTAMVPEHAKEAMEAVYEKHMEEC